MTPRQQRMYDGLTATIARLEETGLAQRGYADAIRSVSLPLMVAARAVRKDYPGTPPATG